MDVYRKGSDEVWFRASKMRWCVRKSAAFLLLVSCCIGYTEGAPAVPVLVRVGGRRQVSMTWKARLPPGFLHLLALSVMMLMLPYHLLHLLRYREEGLGDARDKREGLQDFEDIFDIHRLCLHLWGRRPHPDTAGACAA